MGDDIGSFFARIMKSQTTFTACQEKVDKFYKCLDANSDEIGLCQAVFDDLEDCTVQKLHRVSQGVTDTKENEQAASQRVTATETQNNSLSKDDDDDDDDEEPSEWAKTMASYTGGERIWGEGAEMKRSLLGNFFASIAPKIFEKDDDDDDD